MKVKHTLKERCKHSRLHKQVFSFVHTKAGVCFIRSGVVPRYTLTYHIALIVVNLDMESEDDFVTSMAMHLEADDRIQSTLNVLNKHYHELAPILFPHL